MSHIHVRTSQTRVDDVFLVCSRTQVRFRIPTTSRGLVYSETLIMRERSDQS